MRPKYEVAGVLDAHWPGVQSLGLNTWQMRTLHAIRRCRTVGMGGHIDRCSDAKCGHVRISYNSCRNRHCPKCQGTARENWVAAREADLLPVPYFHVVFTLPSALNQLAMHRPRLVYGLLFKTAWGVLESFASDPKHLGARPGMVAVLHTWGQAMQLHPHLHCIVPGGGLTRNGRWKPCRGKGKYLFPVKAMSKVFRARYMAGLREAGAMTRPLGKALMQHEWTVYAKRPFMGPGQMVEYLGRYTHKIAISNHRILGMDGEKVRFAYKDYRDGARRKEMALPCLEFVRRFALHVLPRGFVRIRHYGILSSTAKAVAIETARGQLPEMPVPQEKGRAKPFDPRQCPKCRKHTMEAVLDFDHRGPPDGWEKLVNMRQH